MKKIGFIDYYISEWHANNYPNWIKEICENCGFNFTVSYAYAERNVSPVDNRTTDEWCKEYGIERCYSIKELCERSDFIIILSPSNPEKHLEYAREALKYGKNTYIDKTFAPNYAEAEEIFSIAKKYGTPFFSSSALRYASELGALKGEKNLITLGGGSSIDEYIIHQIEMVVNVIDSMPTAVSVYSEGAKYISSIKFEGGASATMIYGEALSFSIISDKEHVQISSPFFKNMISDILRFFETGKASFDTNQTLYAIKIRDAILIGREKNGEWIKI